MQQIANTLSFKGYDVSSRTVNRLLKRIGYKVCRKQQNFAEQCDYLNKKIESAKQSQTPIVYISFMKKTKNRTTTSSELRSNTKRLLLNTILSTKLKQHLMINSLFIWKKHFANSLSEANNILILTEYLEPKNAQFWLQALLHFSKKYNVNISVYHIPQGITKWVLPMNKFSVIYPYKNSQNKRETYEVNVCFNTKTSDTAKKTIINNTPLVEFELPKVTVKRQRFLGDFNYQIKDCESKHLQLP
ncbi:hypothetical protein [Candidatus Uabimicrobium sp. HlEnr_7]|uniref:hypothetical protein n=1 Tax=Candidatus Uabimicrobium helgolandensis TaxID=3095367 RepID=UPI003559099D